MSEDSAPVTIFRYWGAFFVSEYFCEEATAMPLQLDYFYGGEADQFNFYRIPKVLFTDEHFKDVSVEAKVLYGLMLDRMSLSVSNEWFDHAGRVYIYFTLEDAIELLCFGKNKAIRLFKELIDIGLIERRKQGQGHPARIYVKNFVIKRRSGSKGHTAKKEQPSRLPAVESADCPKANPNYTESKDTDMSDTDLSFLPFAPSTPRVAQSAERDRNEWNEEIEV